MKIQGINSYYKGYNTNYKSANKIAKYSIGSLIASATLFLGANAVSSLHPNVPEYEKKDVLIMNSAASVLSIAGTALGVVALKKDDA